MQRSTAYLSSRDVYVYGEIALPFRRGAARFPDDPLSHRDNEAGLLGQRNEGRRRDHSLVRMIPANQGLEPADVAARQIDHRLVVELELAGRQRLAQVQFHDAAGLYISGHLPPLKNGRGTGLPPFPAASYGVVFD